MIINGKEGLACKTLVKDALPDGETTIKVEPLKHFPLQKDLMVDPKVFFEKYRSVSPFFIPANAPPKSKEYIQSRDQRKKFDDPTKCILCSACYSACPVLDTESGFIGPAASAQAARFNKDSRDKGLAPRLAVLDAENGVWGCENHFECTRVCPREIKITKLINETKREIKQFKEEKGIE
jgi:succinate dehydrogenase / fumarate reductase iron-sulfur subunit